MTIETSHCKTQIQQLRKEIDAHKERGFFDSATQRALALGCIDRLYLLLHDCVSLHKTFLLRAGSLSRIENLHEVFLPNTVKTLSVGHIAWCRANLGQDPIYDKLLNLIKDRAVLRAFDTITPSHPITLVRKSRSKSYDGPLHSHTTQYRGRCQVCTKDQAILNQTTMIATHGFVMHRGQMTKICEGSGHPPIEQSCIQLDQTLLGIQSRIGHIKLELDGVNLGQILPRKAKASAKYNAQLVDYEAAPPTQQHTAMLLLSQGLMHQMQELHELAQRLTHAKETFFGRELREVPYEKRYVPKNPEKAAARAAARAEKLAQLAAKHPAYVPPGVSPKVSPKTGDTP